MVPPISYFSAHLCPCQIQKVIANLVEQYKGKDEEFENFKREYNIRPAPAN